MKKLILAGLGVCLLALTLGGWTGNATSTFAVASEKKTKSWDIVPFTIFLLI
jgi:hypothetical protein